jgi:hypothetical protein
MSVKDRVKIFIKASGLTVSAFEKSIEASNGYVNSISKSIGGNKTLFINREYSSLNMDWLLTGKGEMLKTAQKPVRNIFGEKEAECSRPEKTLSDFKLDDIVDYLFDNEQVKEFRKNTAYRLFIHSRVQKEVIKEMEEINKRLLEANSIKKNTKKFI